MNTVNGIGSIKYGIISPKEHLARSVAEITGSDTSIGVNDAVFGPTPQHPVCKTCARRAESCIGHWGHISLCTPLFNPIFFKQVVAVLRDICPMCKTVVRTSSLIKKKTAEKYCCSATIPKIITKNGEIFMEVSEDGKKTVHNLTASYIFDLFDKISPENLVRLGLTYHPRDLFFTIFPVIPNQIRPINCTKASDGSNRLLPNDWTTQCENLVKMNYRLRVEKIDLNAKLEDARKRRDPESTIERIRKESSEKIAKLESSMQFIVNTIITNDGDKARNPVTNKPVNSIKSELTGKHGIVRDGLASRRVDNSARAVITSGDTLAVDEVGVPDKMADTLIVPETVRFYNIKRLQNLVNEGKVKSIVREDKRRYNVALLRIRNRTKLSPGDVISKVQITLEEALTGKIVSRNGSATFIIRDYPSLNFHVVTDITDHSMCKEGDLIIRGLNDPSTATILVYTFPNDFKIEIREGDIVERTLMDGDIVALNRQPSLTRMSLQGARVVRHRGYSLTLPPCTTVPYNADYDGDEMNIHYATSEQAQAEFRELMATSKQALSDANGAPVFGAIQNALTTGYMLSKINAVFDSQAFDAILEVCQTMTRNDLRVRLNHLRPNKREPCTFRLLVSVLLPKGFYYTHKKNNVVIRDGVMLSGIVDKSVWGAKQGSMFQAICVQFNSEQCIHTLTLIQRAFVEAGRFFTFSIGGSDCIVPGFETVKKTVIAEKIKKLEVINDKFAKNPRLREAQIIGVMNEIRDASMKKCMDMIDPANQFLCTVQAGSKGDYHNMNQLTGMLGQQINYGERLGKAEDDIFARGFVDNSYGNGLTSHQFFLTAIASREGMVSTTQQVADSGYEQRKMETCLASRSINGLGGVTGLCTVYGLGFDPSMTFVRGSKICAVDVHAIAEKLNAE